MMSAINWKPSLLPRIWGPMSAYDALGKVIEVIRQEPQRYDQYVWLSGKTWNRKPACGTTACVGGWLTVMLGIERSTSGMSEWRAVSEKLGLRDRWVQNALFGAHRAGRNDNPTTHAARGIAHIERFRHKYRRQLQAHIVRPRLGGR